MFDKKGKIENLKDIDIELIKALDEIFKNDIMIIDNKKELYIKKGNIEVIDFIKEQYKILKGKKDDKI